MHAVRRTQVDVLGELVVRVDVVALVGARHLRRVEVGHSHHGGVAAAQELQVPRQHARFWLLAHRQTCQQQSTIHTAEPPQ